MSLIDTDCGLCASFPTIESFYTDLFNIDFTLPIRTVPTIPIIPSPDLGLDPFFAFNETLLQLYSLFSHTTNAPPQSSTFLSSIQCLEATSYSDKFLNMVGNSTQFADHLRSTLLLSIAARNFEDVKRLHRPSAEKCPPFAKTSANILSRVLSHFNIICEHYNIVQCGSFNISDVLHYFFNRTSPSVVNSNSVASSSIFPSTNSFFNQTSPSAVNSNSVASSSIFSSNKSTGLSHFNNDEQNFLSTTLQAAFLSSSMHSTVPDSISFPLTISPDQADTFTQHYTKLLDTPTLTSLNSISPNKVSISRIPFSVFAYLGLLNSIMVDIWSNIIWLIFPSIGAFSLSQPLAVNFDMTFYKNLIQLFISSPSLPDGLWSQIVLFISNLACINIHLTCSLCQEINLFQIMNSKLHSIICFPICVKDPSSSFVTHSSRSMFNAMLQITKSILAHDNLKSSHFYTSPDLHQKCTHFALQTLYIYLIIQWASTSKDWLISSHTIYFSFADCLELLQNVFYSQRHKPTITNQFNSNITNGELPSLSPHLFCLVASLIIRLHQRPQSFLACITPLLVNNPDFALSLYSSPQFSHLSSYILLPHEAFNGERFHKMVTSSSKSKVVQACMIIFRLISTAFLQFVSLNQALRYYSLHISKESNDMVFRDFICSKVPTYTTSSAVVEGALESNLLKIYSPLSQQLDARNLQSLLDDQLSATLVSITTQILSSNLYSITPVDNLAIGLKICQERISQGDNSISFADVLFHPSTLLVVSPIVNVIPYMATHHSFNKTLYYSIVCHRWGLVWSTSLSIRLLFWILGYLELYHTFLCKPIILSTLEEISATSGPLLEINHHPFDIVNATSKQVSQILSNNSSSNNKSQTQLLSCARIKCGTFNMTQLSQHSQFRSSLHQHAHLPPNVVLSLYYSYTEALLNVIMGFSYTQFHLHQNNNPIEPFLAPNTNQPFGKIHITNDLHIESMTNHEPFCSSLSHGTLFQISELFQQNEESDQDGDGDDNADDDDVTRTLGISNDTYSEHILNLYNHPHQLTQLYIPSNRQPTSVVFEAKCAPKFLDLDTVPEKMPLSFEWSSSMVQHSIELFIDLLLNERSYEFVSQIDFSDDNPLAKQSEATLNYFDQQFCGANTTPSAQSRLMRNLPYFYNLTEQQQVALYETYSYDALFSAKYGPYNNVPLFHAPVVGALEFSQENLSHVLTDANTTIPAWLKQSLTGSGDKMAFEPTQDAGLRFCSL